MVLSGWVEATSQAGTHTSRTGCSGAQHYILSFIYGQLDTAHLRIQAADMRAAARRSARRDVGTAGGRAGRAR